MSIMLGHNTWLGMGREAAWGTAATISDWIKVISHDLKNVVPYANRASLGDPSGAGLIPGTKNWAGPVSVEWLYEGLENLLAYCFGAPTITGPTNVSVYTWVFQPQTTLYQGKGLTLETYYDAALSYLWTGGKVNSLAFSMARDQVLQCTAELMGRQWSKDTTPSTPSFPTDRPLLESQFSMEVGDVPLTNVSTLSFNIANAMSGDRAALGSGYVLEPQRNGFVEATGSWAADFLGSTYKDYMDAGTPFKLEFIWTSTADIAGSSPATKYKFAVEFPNALLIGDTPGISSPGVVPETNNFKGAKIGADPSVKITLTTARATLDAET